MYAFECIHVMYVNVCLSVFLCVLIHDVWVFVHTCQHVYGALVTRRQISV